MRKTFTGAHSGERSRKALDEALRRLPTGGWDSRIERQGSSASYPHRVLPFPKKSKAEEFTEMATLLPDVRSDLVEKVRAKIDADDYFVNSEWIAEKLIEQSTSAPFA